MTANGTQPGVTHPLLGSGTCAACHGDYDLANDLEPFTTWAGTMMANSSRDPLFWAALDVANHDRPGVGDWCLRCHVSAGWLAGRSEPPGGSPDGCQLQGRIDQAGGDFDGVSCHLCHRMMENPSPPPGQQSLYHENGQYWLDDGDCGGAGEPCRRGPYDYPSDPLLQPPHAWMPSPLHRSSELCALCHNVTNPVANLLRDGVDTGVRFPIERTHKEWAHSDFGGPTPMHAECQDCHMPQTTAQPAFASIFELSDHHGDLGIHAFAGGNAWVPEVLRQEYPDLGIDDSFRATRQRALDMLQQRSATVAIELAPFVEGGRDATVRVRVTNLAGHKLPTGYPEGRRMWLHLEVRDSQTGALVWESGGYDPATGVLAADPPPKVYEVQQGVWNRFGTGACDVVDPSGQEQFHFVLNNCIVSDNRIPPQGFSGGTDVEMQPVAYTYPETAPGSGRLVHWDDTTYTFPVTTAGRQSLTVTAVLRYQTTRKEYVEFLSAEAAANAFAADCLPRADGPPLLTRAGVLLDMWQRYDRSPPVDMAAATAQTVVTQHDAFLCYDRRVRRGEFTPAPNVALNNSLAQATVELTRPASVCAPIGVGGRGIGDSRFGLATYRARPRTASRQRRVVIRDTLGESVFRLAPRVRLLEPSRLAPGTTPVAGVDAIDAYACFDIRHARYTSAGTRPSVVELRDASGVAIRVRLRQPRRACVATARGATPALFTDAALVCYAATQIGRTPRLPLENVNSFLVNDIEGDHTVSLRRARELCIPGKIYPPDP